MSGLVSACVVSICIHHPKRGRRLPVPNDVHPSLQRHWDGPVSVHDRLATLRHPFLMVPGKQATSARLGKEQKS